MKYAYKATNTEGVMVSGIQVAEDKFALNRDLKAAGMALISAEEEGGGGFFAKIITKLKNFGTINSHEKIVFGKNLSSMLEAGLPLSRALTVMERQTRNKALKKVINDIIADIKAGKTLHASFESHPKVFSKLFIAMVSAGEESGNLIESLTVVSNQMEKNLQLKKKIKGAMIYPGVILGAMVVIAIFMFAFIVPTLTKTFVELELDLPGSTRFVIFVSDLFRNNTILMIIAVIVFIVGFITMLRTKKGRRAFEWFLLHLPMVKGLVKETNSARMARTLSSLLASGVSYVRSIEITHDVIQNSYYKVVIKEAQKNIQLGMPIAKVFEENNKLYPVFVSEMIAVGEETGELSNMLTKIASHYEQEVDEKTKNMSTIIEPFLMIFIGVAVGFFAISMISPMYSIVESI